MAQHDLKPVIEQLRGEAVGEDTYWGIYEYTEEVVYIKANKKGMQLFAAMMLEAVDQHDILINTGEKEYKLDANMTAPNSMPHISHIQFVENKDEVDVVEAETLTQKAKGWGLLAVLFFLIAAMVVGLITIFGWLF